MASGHSLPGDTLDTPEMGRECTDSPPPHQQPEVNQWSVWAAAWTVILDGERLLNPTEVCGPSGGGRAGRCSCQPNPIQEVNVRVLWLSPLSEFSFLFLEYQVLSPHCHPTHPIHFLSPALSTGLAISTGASLPLPLTGSLFSLCWSEPA